MGHRVVLLGLCVRSLSTHASGVTYPPHHCGGHHVNWSFKLVGTLGLFKSGEDNGQSNCFVTYYYC